MTFAYGTVDDKPLIPHMSIARHRAHRDCNLGEHLYMVVADLGVSPIPYYIADLDTFMILEEPGEHLMSLVEAAITIVVRRTMAPRN